MNAKPSYWHTAGPQPLTPLTLGRFVDIAADRWPDREALVSVYQDQRFTFSELRHKIRAFAGSLLALGAAPGDRLAIWGHNCSQWYIAYLAAASIGVITVKLNPALEVPEVIYNLRKVNARVLVYADRCHDMVTQVKSSIRDLLLINMGQEHHGDSHGFSDLLSNFSPEMVDEIAAVKALVQPDDGCDIIFSSGSTGTPKAALVSHHTIVNNILVTGRRMGMHLQEQRWCVTTQFCHATASIIGILSCLFYGGTFIIPSEQYISEETVRVLQQESCNSAKLVGGLGTFSCVPHVEMKTYLLVVSVQWAPAPLWYSYASPRGLTYNEPPGLKCTVMLGIPSQLVDIVDIATTKGITFPLMKVIGVSGAPVSSALVYAVQRAVPSAKIVAILGMTETCVTFMSLLDDSVEKVASTTGYAMDHIEVKLVDPEGRMVPMGTPGELWVRGFNLMLGYWGDEEKTKEVIRSDGWFKTGDQMVLTEDGYGHVVGRLKEMIIRENQNIFPLEIEQFLQGHPDILDVQAFGVPDEKVGEEMCAYVRTKSDVTLTEQDVKNYCKGKIAEWKIPRYVLFADTFPRSATGKVMKKQLQQLALQKLGLQKTQNMLYIPELQGPSVL